MKRVLVLLVMFAATMAFAKKAHAQGYDLTAIGGSVSVDGATLSAPLSPVIWLTNDTTGLGGAATGSFVLQTGNLASGDYQNGATFASGGTVTINASGANGTVSFSGIVTSATWASHKLANSIYFYSLSGNIQDSTTGNTGAFVLTTVNGIVANQKFTGSSQIANIQIHLN